MLKFIWLISIYILLSFFLLQAVENNELRITYIANEGFLFESEDKKVLIDALFGTKDLSFWDVPTTDVLSRLSAAKPPFDDVDLIFISHRHIDHFDAVTVMDHLEINKKCHVIGTQQVVESLEEFKSFETIKNRIHDITPSFGQSEIANLNDIEITVLRLKHCTYFVADINGNQVDRHKDMQNLGFIIKLGSHTLLHIGDSGMENENEFEQFNFPKENIDIAFLGSLFWPPYESRIEIVNNYIKPKQIILMHLEKNDKEKYVKLKEIYQEQLAPITIFKNQMESKAFVK